MSPRVCHKYFQSKQSHCQKIFESDLGKSNRPDDENNSGDISAASIRDYAII